MQNHVLFEDLRGVIIVPVGDPLHLCLLDIIIWIYFHMQALEDLLQRLKTQQQMLLYNKKIVDPYLLAANGLILTSKVAHGQPNIITAVCANQNCSLQLEFDSLTIEEEPKEEIERAVTEHDAECPFSTGAPLKVDAKLFRQVGHQLFEKRVENLQKQQKFIQLSPQEVKQALGLTQSTKQANITLQMFRKLDRRLCGQRLTKVKSSVFLALLGWQLREGENQVVCRFCATTRNVFEYLSPSECTLMSLSAGFPFMSAHRPWCCLIQPEAPLWHETLKQAVLRGLQGVQGRVSRSEAEMRCKEIQENTVRKYAGLYQQWAVQRRILEEFKTTIDTQYLDADERSTAIRSTFQRPISHLESVFDNCKQSVQTFMKRIKMG